MSSLFEIEMSLLWLSICLLCVCFPHTFEQLSFTSTNVQEKWISKLPTILTESLFKSSQNYFCWEIISTQLITIQIYFWHKDCLSLAITVPSIVTVSEPLPPKINRSNKLLQGLSLMLCLYNARTTRQTLLRAPTPNMTSPIFILVINPQIKKIFINQKVQATIRKSQSPHK